MLDDKLPLKQVILIVNQYYKGMKITMLSRILGIKDIQIRMIVNAYNKDPFYLRESKMNNNENNDLK